MTKPWDRDQIVKRADDIAQKKFGCQSSTHFDHRDLPKGLLRRRGKGKDTTPTLGKLETAAEALEVSVPQLMGIEPLDKTADGLDDQRLHLALRTLDEVVGSNRLDADAAAPLVAEAYRIYLDYELNYPDEPLTEATFRTVCSLIRSRLSRNDRLTS